MTTPAERPPLTPAGLIAEAIAIDIADHNHSDLVITADLDLADPEIYLLHGGRHYTITVHDTTPEA
jgi:hypothetical protein